MLLQELETGTILEYQGNDATTYYLITNGPIGGDGYYLQKSAYITFFLTGFVSKTHRTAFYYRPEESAYLHCIKKHVYKPGEQLHLPIFWAEFLDRKKKADNKCIK